MSCIPVAAASAPIVMVPPSIAAPCSTFDLAAALAAPVAMGRSRLRLWTHFDGEGDLLPAEGDQRLVVSNATYSLSSAAASSDDGTDGGGAGGGGDVVW